MRCFESLFNVRVLDERNDDDEKKTTDDLNTLFLSSPVFSVSDKSIHNLHFIVASAKRPKHTTNTHARAHSLTRTTIYTYIHTYIINK